MALVMLLFVTATICLTQITASTSRRNQGSVCGNFPLSPSAGQVYYLSSPHFPRSYENNANCWRLINAPSGFVVRVTVLNANMEQGYDYVQLFDGSSEASPSIARFSSMPSPTFYYSSGQNMYIKFHSDDSVVFSGFRLSYEVVSVPSSGCPVYPFILLARPEYDLLLTSPYYPSHYGNNHRCWWLVEAPPGYVVRVTFLDLNMGNDYLDLIDDGLFSNTVLAHSTVIHPGRNYFSSTMHMSIRFNTDRSATSTGFRLQYRAVHSSALLG